MKRNIFLNYFFKGENRPSNYDEGASKEEKESWMSKDQKVNIFDEKVRYQVSKRSKNFHGKKCVPLKNTVVATNSA